MESCSLVISQILAEFRPERATYKTLHKFIILIGLSKFAKKFTVCFLKLLFTHPISMVVWGNLREVQNLYHFATPCRISNKHF